MLKPILTARDVAERYHRLLPDEVRQYLKGRGIPATLINRQLLGWDGKRVTIPVFGRSIGDVLGFRYATPPADYVGPPSLSSSPDANADLYGWETLARQPHRVVVCEGELDRLVLEARGFPAVTSTAGADTFLREWTAQFKGIRQVFVCFSRGVAGDAAAANVQQMLPKARVARLPADVGYGGTVSDFFIGLERTPLDFEIVLAAGTATGEERPGRPHVLEFRAVHPSLQHRAERVRAAVPLHEIAGRSTYLQAEGGHLAGHCPFHDDNSRSFSVYPDTDTYACSVCGANGDIVKFLMDKESITFGQALEALECFEYTDGFRAS